MIFLILFIITILPLKGLIGPGITDAHDSLSHVVRTYSFYESLKEGNLIPRWSQHLNYGYGHPIFMFLYPLPSYAAALFHFAGFSFIDSVKAVLGVSFIFSGIFTYLWLKSLFGTWPALLGAAFYQLAPYRFVNLYVRDAFGENTAMLFIPLSFWLITKLIKQPNKKHLFLAAISIAGLLLSHNAISLMILPLLCAYALILMYRSESRLLLTAYCLLAIGLGFGLSAFFWLPAFVEGKYTLREVIMKGDAFADGFVYFKQLILPSWGYGVSARGPNDGMSFQVGILQWLAFLLIPVMLLKSRKKDSWLTLLFGAAFLFSIFIMLDISLPIWHLIPIIKKFQFPWRWLTVSVFTTSFLAANLAHRFKFSSQLTFLFTGLLVAQTFMYWQPKGFLSQSETELIQNYIGTTDTGESTPLWAIRFQEKPSPGNLSVVWGAPIEQQILRRQAEIHEYTVTTTTETQVSDNTLYFPGWKAYIDGRQVPIIYDDMNWRGEITFPIPTGTHHVKVVFEDTKLRRFANILSLISLSGLLSTLWLNIGSKF